MAGRPSVLPHRLVPTAETLSLKRVQTKTITDEDIARATLAERPSEPRWRLACPSRCWNPEPSVESGDMPELELDSEILEDATPLPQPPPKPDLRIPRNGPSVHVKTASSGASAAAAKAEADGDDDVSSIVKDHGGRKKPKHVPNAAELKRFNWFVDVFTEEYLRTVPKTSPNKPRWRQPSFSTRLDLKKGRPRFIWPAAPGVLESIWRNVVSKWLASTCRWPCCNDALAEAQRSPCRSSCSWRHA
ncbi:MAG: hypothetical protein R3E66_09950 [bacterium]